MQLDVSTPARERLAADLLAWGKPRPPMPAGISTQLLTQLEAAFRQMGPTLQEAANQARSRRLFIGKTVLDRSTCDGLQLAPEPYVHTFANARGVLAHAAIGEDLESGRKDDPETLVEQVWHDESTKRAGDPSSLSSFLNACPEPDADALRFEVVNLVDTFREVWPPLPVQALRLRIEKRVQVRLAGGAVLLQGIPDLVIDSHREDDRARSLVVDFKTGKPRSEHDRHELRFYALLETLRSGRAPFRWATFYATEGRTEPEDLRVETLEATVHRVIDTVAQLVRLSGFDADAPEDQLNLRSGIGCYGCQRRPTCTVAAADARVPTEDAATGR